MLAIALIIACLVFLWPRICTFLSERFLPRVTEIFGETIGGWLTTLTCWLDRTIRGIRRGFKAGWIFFKERVVRFRTDYSTTDNEKVLIKTTNVIDLGNGKIGEIIETKTHPMDILPLKIQDDIIRQKRNASGSRQVEVDEKSVISEQMKKRLEEDRRLATSQEEEDEYRELNILVNGC